MQAPRILGVLVSLMICAPSSVRAEVDPLEETVIWTGIVAAGALAPLLVYGYDPPREPNWPFYLEQPAGLPMEDESFPSWALAVSVLAVGGGLLAVPTEDDFGMAQYRLGQRYLLTMGLTAAATYSFKNWTGRRRPDYEDRLRLHEAGDERCGESCVVSGRRSFFSGHAALVFASATFATLYLVDKSRDPAITAVGTSLALAGAGLVSWSRVWDNRHHWTDVIIGAVVGAGIATACYLLFPDPDLDAFGQYQP